jgi:hypothetical protein
VRRAGNPDAYVRQIVITENRTRFRKHRVAEQLTDHLPEPASDGGTGRPDDRVALMAALRAPEPADAASGALRDRCDRDPGSSVAMVTASSTAVCTRSRRASGSRQGKPPDGS